MHRLAFLLFAITSGLLGQDLPSSFVIDHSRSFAYLVFDHIGTGKLYSEKDVPERIFLRVVNNCRVPILFRAEGPSDSFPGYIFEDEVVPEEEILQIVSSPEEMNAVKQQETDRIEAMQHKPDGYEFEVSGVVRVLPGKDGLFSIPRNHVDRFWFARVRFALDVDRSALSAGPFTYLDIHNWDLPKAKQ